MILITLRNCGYADSRMTCGIAQSGLTPAWDTDRTNPGERHEGSRNSCWPGVSAGYSLRPRSFLLVILVPAQKHHERRVAPTPVGWLKALRPNSLSAPAYTLLAWGRSGSTMSGLGKKGKPTKIKSQG